MQNVGKSLSRAENADLVIEWFRSNGFRVNPTSRLQRMRDLLHAGYIEYDDPRCAVALESLRDMVELGFIIEQLGGHVDDPDFREKMRLVAGDNPLPQQDRQRSPGRDAHWELYLGAICQSAGMTALCFHGNDVNCIVAGKPFCIEAKRIKSEENADARIKEAIDQIIKSGRPGIVALDMSLAWNLDNRHIHGSIENAFLEDSIAQKSWAFLKERKRLIWDRGGGRGVVGVALFNFFLRWRGEKWIPDRQAMWLAVPDTDHKRRLYRTFKKQFCAVKPNRHETIVSGNLQRVPQLDK